MRILLHWWPVPFFGGCNQRNFARLWQWQRQEFGCRSGKRETLSEDIPIFKHWKWHQIWRQHGHGNCLKGFPQEDLLFSHYSMNLSIGLAWDATLATVKLGIGPKSRWSLLVGQGDTWKSQQISGIWDSLRLETHHFGGSVRCCWRLLWLFLGPRIGSRWNAPSWEPWHSQLLQEARKCQTSVVALLTLCDQHFEISWAWKQEALFCSWLPKTL